MQETSRGDRPNSIAIIVGGSEKVWDEYAAAKEIAAGLPLTIFAVNDMIGDIGGDIDHAVTLHAAKLQMWFCERRSKGLGFPMPKRVWSQPPLPHHVRTKRHFAEVTDQTTEGWGLSSGTFAIKIARELHFEKIVICGVPLDRRAGHFRRKREWVWAPTPRTALKPMVSELRSFVRSMSGTTCEWFGYPSRSWLENVDTGNFAEAMAAR